MKQCSSVKINKNEKACNCASHLRFFTTQFWKELTVSRQQYQLVCGFTVRYIIRFRFRSWLRIWVQNCVFYFDFSFGFDSEFLFRFWFSSSFWVSVFTFSKWFQHQLRFVLWFDHDSILIHVLIKIKTTTSICIKNRIGWEIIG